MEISRVTPEIRAVGVSAWPLPAAAPQPLSAPTPDPVDGTVLGSVPPPEKKPTLPVAESRPEPPPPPAPGSEPLHDLWPLKLRLAEREQALPQIWSGQELERWAESSDPVVAQLARRRLAERFSLPETRLQENAARYGPVEGPRMSLDWLARASSFDARRSYQALELLEKGLAGQPPPQAAMVTLVRVAHRALQSDQTRSVAEIACRLLGCSDGLKERLLPVVDGRVQVSPPLSDSPARQVALEVLERMPALGEPEGATRLESLNDPAVARALVEEMTRGVPTDDQLSALGRLLEQASKRPRLAALFAPHRQELLQVAPHAQSLGVLGGGAARLMEGLLLHQEVPPEAVDSQLQALLACTSDDSRMWASTAARALLERRPQAAAVLLDRLALKTPHEADWALLSHALDRGWKPDPLQRDQLLSWMVPPYDSGPELHLTRYTFTAPALALARKLGDLSELRLPDRQGQLTPYREALLDHALAGELSTAWAGTGDFMALLCPAPDPALERKLLEGLPETCPPRLSSCTPEQKSRLSLLSLMPLSPATRQLLNQRLAPCLALDQSQLEPLVSDERQRQLTEAAAGLEQGDLPDRLQSARRCVELTFQRGYRDQGNCFDFPELNQALAMVSQLPPGDRKQVAGWLSNRLLAPTPLHELAPERLADFVLAVPLMADDPSLERRLKAMVVPRQSSTMPVYTAREHFLSHLEPLERARLRQGLEPDQARAVVDGLTTLRQWDSDQDLAAWAEGARDWAGEIVARHGEHHEDAYAAFSELLDTGQPQVEWENLRGILNRLEAAGLMRQQSDPERFQQALTMWREVRAGGSMEQVLEAHGLASCAGHGGVVETGGFVSVGGALLRRRTAR